MKKTFTLFVLLLGLCSVLSAQTALDPNDYVNNQITEAGVYTVEAGKAYAFDGRIDLTFDVTIEGPDGGWIGDADNPPVFVNTPAADGSARDFIEIKEGGSLRLKNVLFSGSNSNDEVSGTFVTNTAGSKLIADNCAFVDWTNFAIYNTIKGDSLSVTNCLFINGVRLRNAPWGGFPLRLSVACDNTVVENNTVVNSGRLLTNSGPFHNAHVHEIHNTYLNTPVCGHEQRANEFITVNNIFYNYHFLGRKNDNAVVPSIDYEKYFTTWNYFADSKDVLEDSISLYLGQNLYYRDQEILDWYDSEETGDTLAASLLWEHPDVDSFIVADDNYTIGTNYAEIDPGFTSHPGNTQAILGYMHGYWLDPTADWVDWRVESPVSYDGGLPVLSWPPAFDLSYSNAGLQTAGTDGLPLGDLNWFPAKKAEYLANKDAILAVIRDSMVNATAVYNPETMDETPLIKEIITVSVEQVGESMNISVYPNPARDMVSVNGIDQPGAVITFYDIMGKEVQFVKLEGLNAQLDISDFDKGVYLYRISKANNVDIKAGKLMIVK